MGNNQVQLSSKQQHLYSRYPRKGIIESLNITNHPQLEKTHLFEDINYNLEHLTWVIHDTLARAGQVKVSINHQRLSNNPYDELLSIIKQGVKNNNLSNLEEVSRLLASEGPEPISTHSWSKIDGDYLSITTGLTIPVEAAINYPVIDPLLRLTADANWVMNQGLTQITGFTSRNELEDVVSRLTKLTRGTRVFDLDSQGLINKPSWSKKKYIDTDLRVASNSESRYLSIRTLLGRNIKTPPIVKQPAKTNKRKQIPKAVKNQVWEAYCGKNYTGRCYVCSSEITVVGWEAAHIQADSEGGEPTIDNLRPSCLPCNRSMSKQNMWDYIRSYHPTRAAELGL